LHHHFGDNIRRLFYSDCEGEEFIDDNTFEEGYLLVVTQVNEYCLQNDQNIFFQSDVLNHTDYVVMLLCISDTTKFVNNDTFRIWGNEKDLKVLRRFKKAQ
jgi:hypothetical protein